MSTAIGIVDLVIGATPANPLLETFAEESFVLFSRDQATGAVVGSYLRKMIYTFSKLKCKRDQKAENATRLERQYALRTGNCYQAGM